MGGWQVTARKTKWDEEEEEGGSGPGEGAAASEHKFVELFDGETKKLQVRVPDFLLTAF